MSGGNAGGGEGQIWVRPKRSKGLGGFRAIFSFWNGSQHIDPSGDFALASMGMGGLGFGSF